MKGTFAVTTHVPVDRITDWLLAHGYASRVDADVDLIMSLLDHQPITFEHNGLQFSVDYVGAVDAYDVSMAMAGETS
jgi:hypothetical protein